MASVAKLKAAPDVPESALTDVELGSVIALLQRQQHRRRANSRSRRPPWVSTGRRRYSDEQIRQLLHIDQPTLARCLTAYRDTIRPWDGTRVRDAVVAFAQRENRWPTMNDFATDPALPASSTYYLNGGPGLVDRWVGVPANARRLSPQLLLTVRNVTVRNQAIEAAGGIQRMIRRGGAERVARDEYGTLWRMPDGSTTDPHAVWLEVVNATETNGKREHFFLRVPPGMTEPKAAVEWSFRIEGELERFAAAT